MDYDDSNSRLSLKLVVILSVFLVSMDFLEIYYSFNQLKEDKIRLNESIFENCIQFNILSQIVFTFFASLAGISAFFLGMGLLFDSDLFVRKLSRLYLYFNYIAFGPYLFAATVFGMMYFEKIVFTCDSSLINRYLNISNLMSLVVCFILSSIITLGYSFFFSINFIYLSIRFKQGGFKPLGKIFWQYVSSRTTQNNNQINQHLLDNIEINSNTILDHLENNSNSLTIHELSRISFSFNPLEENVIENEEIRDINEKMNDEFSINCDRECEYKNDKLCEILQKIINNDNTNEDAKKRAINALNLRKKLLSK